MESQQKEDPNKKQQPAPSKGHSSDQNIDDLFDTFTLTIKDPSTRELFEKDTFIKSHKLLTAFTVVHLTICFLKYDQLVNRNLPHIFSTSFGILNGILSLIAFDKLDDNSFRKFKLLIKFLQFVSVPNFAIGLIAFNNQSIDELKSFEILQFTILAIIASYKVCQNQISPFGVNIVAVYFSVVAKFVKGNAEWQEIAQGGSFALLIMAVMQIWLQDQQNQIWRFLKKNLEEGEPKEIVDVLNMVEQGVMILKQVDSKSQYRFQIINQSMFRVFGGFQDFVSSENNINSSQSKVSAYQLAKILQQPVNNQSQQKASTFGVMKSLWNFSNKIQETDSKKTSEMASTMRTTKASTMAPSSIAPLGSQGYMEEETSRKMSIQESGVVDLSQAGILSNQEQNEGGEELKSEPTKTSPFNQFARLLHFRIFEEKQVVNGRLIDAGAPASSDPFFKGAPRNSDLCETLHEIIDSSIKSGQSTNDVVYEIYQPSQLETDPRKFVKVKISSIRYKQSNSHLIQIEDVSNEVCAEEVRQERELVNVITTQITRDLNNFTNQINTANSLLNYDVDDFFEMLRQDENYQIPEELLKTMEGIAKKARLSFDSSGQFDLYTKNFYDFMQIKLGKFKRNVKYFDPREVFSQVAILHQNHANLKGVQLNLQFATGTPEMIQSDPDRINQVLCVLVSNSIKYSEFGGSVEILCKVYEEYRKRFLRIKVKDHGSGIPFHMRDKIFSIFGNEPHQQGSYIHGSGLNLHICQMILKQFDTQVSFETKEGDRSGSIFTFCVEIDKETEFNNSVHGNQIDMYMDELDQFLKDEMHNFRIQPEFNYNITDYKGHINKMIQMQPAHILVCDSNMLNIEVIKLFIDTFGRNIKVDRASSGKQALEKVSQRNLNVLADSKISPYRLMFIECSLPVVDGVQTASMIRKMNKSVNLKTSPYIVGVTAQQDQFDPSNSQMNEIMTKPINRDKLMRFLKRLNFLEE